jgi:hypothetical protein
MAVSRLGMYLHLQVSDARNKHFAMASELSAGPRKALCCAVCASGLQVMSGRTDISEPLLCARQC